MSIPSEDIIINALNHEIRREILRLLEHKPLSYTNLLDYFTVSTGKLNYHIKLLTGFVQKDPNGNYELTKLGKNLLQILQNFNQIINEENTPLLKRAFLSQFGGKGSFLQIRLVGGLYFKLIAISTIFILMITLTIFYVLNGVSLLYVWPFIIMSLIIGITGFIWVFKQFKPAKQFTQRFDKLLSDSDE